LCALGFCLGLLQLTNKRGSVLLSIPGRHLELAAAARVRRHVPLGRHPSLQKEVPKISQGAHL
jgi:hypothetical protein